MYNNKIIKRYTLTEPEILKVLVASTCMPYMVSEVMREEFD